MTVRGDAGIADSSGPTSRNTLAEAPPIGNAGRKTRSRIFLNNDTELDKVRMGATVTERLLKHSVRLEWLESNGRGWHDLLPQFNDDGCVI
jgi:hypothetical protein